MNYESGRTCRICGAPITDENPDGIGWQCREVYNRAKREIFFCDSERTNKYNKIFVDAMMLVFETRFGKTKFRSSFWKEFYPSIIQQHKDGKHISRRQREIVMGKIMGGDMYMGGYGYDVKDSNYPPEMRVAINAQDDMMKDWINHITTEEAEHIHNLANKYRHDPKYQK